MTYGLENETDAKFDFDVAEIYKKAVDTVLDIEDCPYEAQVDLLITDDEGIREINREQRGIDAPTDVLSFPMVQYERARYFSKLEDTEDSFNIETGELMLGDIVLSEDRIRVQAEEYGHSIKREFAFLIVHSMLHLIGYDHIEEDDRIVMEKRQKDIMEEMGLPR